MTVFGVLTQKRSVYAGNFNNRYYVNVSDIEEAISVGIALAQLERIVFSDVVTFYNIHAWQPNANPNVKRNSPMSVSGLMSGATPLKPEMVLRMNFSGEGNDNPNFKNYRTQVSSGYIVGHAWASTVVSSMVDYQEEANELGAPVCTRSGELIQIGTFDLEYQFQQMSKAWYNRGS